MIFVLLGAPVQVEAKIMAGHGDIATVGWEFSPVATTQLAESPKALTVVKTLCVLSARCNDRNEKVRVKRSPCVHYMLSSIAGVGMQLSMFHTRKSIDIRPLHNHL